MEFVCIRVGPSYKWWQQWDDVDCQSGVALLKCFPGQISRVSLVEGKYFNLCEKLTCKLALPVHRVRQTRWVYRQHKSPLVMS